MCLRDLISKREALASQIVRQINEDNARIRMLAEEMAECATNIQGHGYNAFIIARDNFLKEMELMRLEYVELLSLD